MATSDGDGDGGGAASPQLTQTHPPPASAAIVAQPPEPESTILLRGDGRNAELSGPLHCSAAPDRHSTTSGRATNRQHLSFDRNPSESESELFVADEHCEVLNPEFRPNPHHHQHEHPTHEDHAADLTTVRQTYLHILKGNVGPGCLSLPWAMSVLGLPLGLATLLILCTLTSYNCWAVVKWKIRHAGGLRSVTYSDLGETAYGINFRRYVTICVCTTQLCVCTVFFSFIGENVSSVLRAVVSDGTPLADSRVVISLVLPLAMLLSCAPNLRILAPATAIGMVMLFISFGIIGGIIGQNWEERPEELPTVDWKRAPLAMCAVMYSFEGINLVLPIEAAMLEPKKFDWVFGVAMASVTAIYAAFSCLCVVAFGAVDNGSVTAFLMEHQDQFSAKQLVLAANFTVSLSVLVTYPLQLFPAINLVSQLRERRAHPTTAPGMDREINSSISAPLEVANGPPSSCDVSFMPLHGDHEVDAEGNGGRSSSGDDGDDDEAHFAKGGGIFQNHTTFEGDSPLLRAGLVLGTYLFAILIPNVQELISLSGALAGSSAALIIPPLLELRSILETHHRFALVAVKRYVLLSIGVLFLLIGTAASVIDIVKAFAEGKGGNR